MMPLALSFMQPWMLFAIPLIAIPIIVHLINQWRYRTKPWGAMMFLLAANRMNRGLAKVRQWLILALRCLAVAGLIFAVARPLSSGLLGWTGGGSQQSTYVLIDRSPSMQQLAASGETKLETGRRQIASALETLGAKAWFAVDSSTGQVQQIDSPQALVDSPILPATSATSKLPLMLSSVLEHIVANKVGNAEIWISSDMRRNDWDPDSGAWNTIRDGFKNLPQSVRFNLLEYEEAADANVAIRVSEVRKSQSGGAAFLSLNMNLGDLSNSKRERTIPVQIEINGARSEHTFTLNGGSTEIKDYRLPLPPGIDRGWGIVSIPGDENNADNEDYFVFDDPPPRRVVIVSEDRDDTRPLEIASSIGADGEASSTVEVLEPSRLDSLVLDEAALLIWQTDLPTNDVTSTLDNYVNEGGQILFFPPSGLDQSRTTTGVYRGIQWGPWQNQKILVENWRGDQDLLAATNSGASLPVGQLEISGHAKLTGTANTTTLATLTGGDPLVARVPTERGGIYFVTSAANPTASTLAQSGVVLFVAIQRAIAVGQNALGNTDNRVAGVAQGSTDDALAQEAAQAAANWKTIAGNTDSLSIDLLNQAGIYQEDDRLFAITRSPLEDRVEVVQETDLARIFSGLNMNRIQDTAGNVVGLVREVWKLFLFALIFALLGEAILCLPKVNRQVTDKTSSSKAGFTST